MSSIAVIIHCPYLLQLEELASLLEREDTPQTVLLDGFTVKPQWRNDQEQFIDLQLQQDNLENIPIKIYQIQSTLFMDALQEAFPEDEVDIAQFVEQVVSQEEGAPPPLLFDTFSLHCTEKASIKKVFIWNHLCEQPVESLTEENRDEISLLIQNYMDFLDDLEPSQLQYMILRIFSDFPNDQASQINTLVKDYLILKNQEQDQDLDL